MVVHRPDGQPILRAATDKAVGAIEMTEENLTSQELAAFNDRMFTIMVAELATLPFPQLCSMHDELVDKHNETAASDERAAVGFALSAMGAAIRQRQIKRAMN